MNITVMRRIRFCAGHRLLGHEGKCANFHGHSYAVDFYVTPLGEDPSHVDDVGRVIDFAELKSRLKGWIDEHWDHGFLLSRDDENGIAAMQAVEPSKLFLLSSNPTAENMARYLLEKVCPELLAPCGVEAVRIDLWESEETCAIVTARSGVETHRFLKTNASLSDSIS
ncbi:MAG: 6-carboxytetrahydropterin synthase [Planctomycetaceae bacterium]|nr:6-carboxytetrahydropterin synthase [Planctomycetaceae bacterium]